MISIKYIGAKPVKTDNVAGTGTVWVGPGDVQAVSPEAAAKLLAHVGVWARADITRAQPPAVRLADAEPAPHVGAVDDQDVDDAAAQAEQVSKTASTPGEVANVGDATVMVDALDELESPALHELAKQMGVKVHHAAGAAKVRAAILAARE